jgi:hypothetical protein
MREQARPFRSTLARWKRVDWKFGWLNQALLGAVVATLCLASPTASQQPEEAIVIAGQRFEIGMPKEAALARLAECCILNGPGDSFIIVSKRPPIDRGSIRFADGKVATVRRDVGEFQESESIILAQTLFRLIRELTHSHPARVSVQTDETEGEGATIRDVSLEFSDGRRVILEVSKVDANPKAAVQIPDWVNVYEVLEKP